MSMVLSNWVINVITTIYISRLFTSLKFINQLTN